jgi:hypothetical protein
LEKAEKEPDLWDEDGRLLIREDSLSEGSIEEDEEEDEFPMHTMDPVSLEIVLEKKPSSLYERQLSDMSEAKSQFSMAASKKTSRDIDGFLSRQEKALARKASILAESKKRPKVESVMCEKSQRLARTAIRRQRPLDVPTYSFRPDLSQTIDVPLPRSGQDPLGMEVRRLIRQIEGSARRIEARTASQQSFRPRYESSDRLRERAKKNEGRILAAKERRAAQIVLEIDKKVEEDVESMPAWKKVPARTREILRICRSLRDSPAEDST